MSATNGTIELEGYEGKTVEVRAERSARAVTDEAARELVSKIAINEEVTPDRVAIRTEGVSGLLIGVSYQVKYHIRAPHSVVARLRVTNGVVTRRRFAGHLIAASTNGGDCRARRSAAGSRHAPPMAPCDCAAGGRPDGVSLRTTNGACGFTLPASAKADLSAECRNGGRRVEGFSSNRSASSRAARCTAS